MKFIVKGNCACCVLRNILSPHSILMVISGRRAVCNNGEYFFVASLAKKVNKLQQV